MKMEQTPIETARQLLIEGLADQVTDLKNGLLIKVKDDAMLKAKKQMEISKVVDDFQYWMQVMEHITNFQVKDFTNEQQKG